MESIQSQGLVVAACLIGCAVFAIALCIKVLPSPAESLPNPEQSDLKRNNRLVLGWVALACVSIVAGHLVVYYMLSRQPILRQFVVRPIVVGSTALTVGQDSHPPTLRALAPGCALNRRKAMTGSVVLMEYVLVPDFVI